MKICVAGQGAFGQKHLDALKRIPDAEVTSLVGGNQDATAQVAKKYGIPHHIGDLAVLALRVAARLGAASCRPAPRGLFSRMMWPTAVFEAGTV